MYMPCGIEGKPYFVAKDVAEILVYGNPRDAINKHVDEEVTALPWAGGE